MARAISKLFRGVCLVCLCILGSAAIVAIPELVAAPALLKATGCSPIEILPGVTCGDGWVHHAMEIVLNLPFLFVMAVAFTAFPTSSPPSREFMLLLYLFDVILALALAYPLLRLFTWKRARRGQ
jgi:hypothetical protein